MASLNICRCIGVTFRNLNKQTASRMNLLFNTNSSGFKLNQFSCKFSVSVFKLADEKRENINIGTIGHIDHGKTTLTAAITKICAEKNKGSYVSYDKIDSAPEEKRRGITINLMHVGYSTEKRNYAHVDCPGHHDFIKNMITGTSQMDASILVIAATEGVMPQTREHLALAKAIGIKHIVVYINKADLADDEMLDLVDMEVRELLTEFGYNGDETPIVNGSALLALDDTSNDLGKKSVIKLMDTIDNYIPSPKRDLDSPFLLPIEKTVAIPGRGQVLVGTITRGTLKKGSPLEIVGFGETIKTTATEIHIFKNSVGDCSAGQHVGILVRGIKPGMVVRGMMASVPNSTTQADSFEATVYMLKKDEGGRKKPILDGYIQPLLTQTCTIDSYFDFPEDKTMLLGGEFTSMNVLLKKPMVLFPGDRFTIRENLTLNSCTGVISKVLPNTDKKIPGFNQIKVKPNRRGRGN